MLLTAFLPEYLPQLYLANQAREAATGLEPQALFQSQSRVVNVLDMSLANLCDE